MRIFYSDTFVLPLPEGHRFPMEKYSLLRERVFSEWPDQRHRLTLPAGATDEELSTVHRAEYLRKVIDGTLSATEIRRIGFPWSPVLVERSRRSVGATLQAARAAMEEGLGVNLSGGTHHAFPDRGEGYCVFNDVAVAASVLKREGLVRRVAILDLDVHQGNGTAFIFRNDPEVFTLSVHGANNYPFKKEPGDLDLELPDGSGDESFLETAEEGVRRTLEGFNPDLAFFLAGADPYVGDRLGRLDVSKDGMERRDRMVLTACNEARVPVVVVMGGGYASPITDTVDIHFTTVRVTSEFFQRWPDREF